MNSSFSFRQKLIIAFGAVVIIVLVVLIALNARQKLRTSTTQPVQSYSPVNTQGQANSSQGQTAPSLGVIPNTPVSSSSLAAAKPVAPGSSPVTKDNLVVTPQGTPVQLNVTPASSQAPTESAPIASSSQAQMTANTIKISASSADYSPHTFTVKAGQLVNFVLTSTDNYTHIFIFDNPSLSGATLGVAGHETREKSWNAPQAGTYTFTINLPGYTDTGFKGSMIVTP